MCSKLPNIFTPFAVLSSLIQLNPLYHSPILDITHMRKVTSLSLLHGRHIQISEQVSLGMSLPIVAIHLKDIGGLVVEVQKTNFLSCRHTSKGDMSCQSQKIL